VACLKDVMLARFARQPPRHTERLMGPDLTGDRRRSDDDVQQR